MNPTSSAELAKNIDLTGDAVPLRLEENGTLRVGMSRVTLDSVISAFHAGESPETIAQSFPTIALDEVYGVIAFFLRHRQEVDAYLAMRQREGEETRRQVEAKWPPAQIRARLLARMQAKGIAGHVETGNG